MTVECHSEILPLESEWDELADRTGASPLVRPGWSEAWWTCFGRGRLHIMALRRNGRLVAVLPLARRGSALRSLTNWHQMEFSLVAEDDVARRQLLNYLFEQRRRAVSIRFFERSGPDYKACVAAAHAHGNRVLTRVVERSPYLRVEGDWKSYLATRTKRMSDVRRRRRRLDELGEVAFRVEDGSRRLDELLSVGFGIEGSGWKSAQGTAIVSHPQTLEFYTRVSHWAASRGWLRLAFLELSGRPIAFLLMMQAAGAAFLLKAGYEPDYRKFAPGMLIRYELLSLAFREGLDRVEFLGGEDADKLIWTSSVRERMDVRTFPMSVGGRTRWAAHVYGRPLAKRTRQLVTQRKRGSGSPTIGRMRTTGGKIAK